MPSILVIDDDKITHSYIKKALETEYQLFPAFNGKEGIEKSSEINPDIILLDVEMPGMNGYEVCEILKSTSITKNTPVIFLSGLGDLRERMQGFEAGADDYIVKPFQPEALKAKIQVFERYKKSGEQLTSQIKEAQETAHIAIAGSSDLGQAMHFIERCHWVKNLEDLANEFFNISNYLNLSCTLVMETEHEEVFFSSNLKSVPPLESELVSTLRQEERFFDFGCRTQINYQNISLLIKNMPLDDMKRYGRIKDLFPAMLSAADSKVSQLLTLNTIKDNSEELSQSFSEVNHALKNIQNSIHKSNQGGVRIMRDMLTELDKELPRMGLEDDQEQYLLDRIDRAINDAHTVTSMTKEIAENFNIIMTDLDQQLERQQALQMRLSTLLLKDEQNNTDEGYAMDVELF